MIDIARPQLRRFARRAAELLAERIAEARQLRQRRGGGATAGLRHEVAAALAEEEQRGSRLAELRTKVNALHKHLRALSEGPPGAAPRLSLAHTGATWLGTQGMALPPPQFALGDLGAPRVLAATAALAGSAFESGVRAPPASQPRVPYFARAEASQSIAWGGCGAPRVPRRTSRPRLL